MTPNGNSELFVKSPVNQWN